MSYLLIWSPSSFSVSLSVSIPHSHLLPSLHGQTTCIKHAHFFFYLGSMDNLIMPIFTMYGLDIIHWIGGRP